MSRRTNPAGGVDPRHAVPWARRQGRAFSWLLLFARAKRSNSLLRSRGESSAFKLSLLALPLARSTDFLATALVRTPGSSLLAIQGKPEQGQKQNQGLSLPFGARATFLCSCKETWPKESTPCLRALRACGTPGPLRRRDFSTRHPCRVEKRRASMHVAPAGSCPSAPSLRKGPGSQKPGQKQKQKQNHRNRNRNGGQAPCTPSISTRRSRRHTSACSTMYGTSGGRCRASAWRTAGISASSRT